MKGGVFIYVVIFCAALAAAHASLVGPLGYGKGLIATPAVATVSTKRTPINHHAPAAQNAAAALLVVAGPIVGGPVLAAGHLGIGRGLIAAAPAVVTLSTQRTAINHVAPAAHIAAVTPFGYAAAAAPIAFSNGAIAGNGILANGLVAGHFLAAPLANGNGLLGAHYGLGVGRIAFGKALL